MRVVIRGTAQDGGIPHLGCSCPVCGRARDHPTHTRYPTALTVTTDTGDPPGYLVDPTPELRFQLPGTGLDGVFITHGHYGHITGLLALGTEVLDTTHLPVYCTPQTREFITANEPFSLLIDRDQIAITAVRPGEPIRVLDGTVTPVRVPHRTVTTDTIALELAGPRRRLLYATDFDDWTPSLITAVETADIALLDGTFWDETELEPTRMAAVPHPPVTESIQVLADTNTTVYFTHHNHTNPLLTENSDARARLDEQGFRLAERGHTFHL